MRKRHLLYCSTLLAFACTEGGLPGGAADQPPSPSDAYKGFVAKIEDALGVFNDIKVFEQDSATKAWRRVSGEYVPVTVHGKTPTRYVANMQSDMPMMLPTRVQGFTGGDGQSSPYSVVGRMPGSNPEVQWVFVVRQYSMKDTTDVDFPNSGDIAVIGHHPRTGATVFLQFYEPSTPKSGQVVVSPFSPNGAQFWSPVDTIARNFQCQRCHNAGPFIHTPWINQVKVRHALPGAPPAEAMVPSDPLGPYFFIDAADGELFAPWDSSLVASKGGGHLSKPSTQPANACISCHRIAPGMIGLNQNATRYVGLDSARFNKFSVRSDSFQIDSLRKLHWMAALAPPYVDFYSGQGAFDPSWTQSYGPSAAEVNQYDADSIAWKAAHTQGRVADVPRPPKQYQSIVVDRPNQDQVAPNQSLWLVDSRMRANTDGDLQQWRFFGKGAGNDSVLAMPVVYRRTPNNGGTNSFDVVFVGEARRYASAGQWVPLQAQQTFRVRQGDYFGIVFTNTGSTLGSAVVPYTDDDWAKLKMPDGTTWLRDGSVAYRLTTAGIPNVGKRLVFTESNFRTYSFEFKNKL